MHVINKRQGRKYFVPILYFTHSVANLLARYIQNGKYAVRVFIHVLFVSWIKWARYEIVRFILIFWNNQVHLWRRLFLLLWYVHFQFFALWNVTSKLLFYTDSNPQTQRAARRLFNSRTISKPLISIKLFFISFGRNKMLQMFKGDTSFIPKGLRKSQLMVVSIIRKQIFW